MAEACEAVQLNQDMWDATVACAAPDLTSPERPAGEGGAISTPAGAGAGVPSGGTGEAGECSRASVCVTCECGVCVSLCVWCECSRASVWRVCGVLARECVACVCGARESV